MLRRYARLLALTIESEPQRTWREDAVKASIPQCISYVLGQLAPLFGIGFRTFDERTKILDFC
jgi:hypothetical protein